MQHKHKPQPESYWEPLWPGKPLGSDEALARTNEVWVNDKCQVLVYDYPPKKHPAYSPENTREDVMEQMGLNGWPKVVELSLKLNTREPWNDWRDFYRIKSELCGTACWAMQMYPSQAELLDTANQYHMYVLDPSCSTFPLRQLQPPMTDYGPEWEKTIAALDEQMGPGSFAKIAKNAKQRPWQEHHKCDDLPLIGPVWAKRGWVLDEDGKPVHKPRGAGTFGYGK